MMTPKFAKRPPNRPPASREAKTRRGEERRRPVEGQEWVGELRQDRVVSWRGGSSEVGTCDFPGHERETIRDGEVLVKRLTRAVLFYMYWICDIGKVDDAKAD
jgi:hypothetical protein